MDPRLQLFGEPKIDTGEGVRVLPLDKPASLLYHLALRGAWVGRSELAFLYRPDAPERVALANVRVYLHRLRERFPFAELESERGRVRLRIATDVAAFRAALEREAWEAALELYRGPLLAGLQLADVPSYETWLELERQDLTRAWRAAALRHAHALELRRDLAGASALLERLRRDDPFDESALQAQLRVLCAAGKRSAARDAYEAFRGELERELDVEPLEATRALLDELLRADAGADAFAVPVALGHDLPAQSTRFVGRKRELARLAEMLSRSDCRLLTLVGLGGSGKTRLALELAAGRTEAFADGVRFVPLAGVAAPELLASIIAGVVAPGLAPSADPEAQLVDVLRNRRTLLLLDNFEHLVEGSALLERLLEAAPGLVLLVTSRVALELAAERLFDVEGLAYPPVGTTEPLASFDAVKLFIERAERVSTAFVPEGATLTAVADLTRLVEGLPLALELAASWTRAASVPQLLADLEEDPHRLTGRLRDLPERHRSLEAVFAYAWERLAGAERDALARLSLFRGGFTLEAAERVAEVHLALLLALINRSLLRRASDGRYGMHELVRRYAQRTLPPEVEVGVEAELSRYYLGLVERLEPDLLGSDPQRAHAALRPDLDNLRLACELAVRNEDWAPLATALPSLRTLLDDLGLLREGRALFERVAAASAPGDDGDATTASHRLHAGALASLGYFERLAGSLQKARTALEQAVRLLRGIDAGRELAFALVSSGLVANRLGHHDEGEVLLREGLDRSRAVGDDHLRADALIDLANVERGRGDYPAAIRSLRSALALEERLGDAVGTADALLNLAGILREHEGWTTEHVRLLERAAELFERAGHEHGHATASHMLGLYALSCGDFGEAEARLASSLETARRVGGRLEQIYLLHDLGLVCLRRGRYDDADRWFREALDANRAFHSAVNEILLFTTWGENARLQRRLAEAHRRLRRALELARSGDAPIVYTLSALHKWAGLQADEGATDEALLLSAFVMRHGGARRTTAERAEARFRELAADLPADAVKRLEREAASLDLAALLERQLASPEPRPEPR